MLFDFGGVFTSSPLAMARRTAQWIGVDPDALLDLMVGNYGVESEHPWQRVERGELALEEARVWARLETRRRLGVEIDPVEVMAPLFDEPVRQPMVDLVRELREAGATTGLLTNNARELQRRWDGLADWGSLFDAVIDSSQVGVRKPAPEAYAVALERCGQAEAGRALMVDDFEVNISGACAVGMRGVLVGEDPSSAMAEIRELVLR